MNFNLYYPQFIAIKIRTWGLYIVIITPRVTLLSDIPIQKLSMY